MYQELMNRCIIYQKHIKHIQKNPTPQSKTDVPCHHCRMRNPMTCHCWNCAYPSFHLFHAYASFSWCHWTRCRHRNQHPHFRRSVPGPGLRIPGCPRCPTPGRASRSATSGGRFAMDFARWIKGHMSIMIHHAISHM